MTTAKEPRELTPDDLAVTTVMQDVARAASLLSGAVILLKRRGLSKGYREDREALSAIEDRLWSLGDGIRKHLLATSIGNRS